MVYKKYIQRGGKTYGPYIYHSRRENGKVITEYHGKKNHQHLFKIFLYVFIGIFLFIGFYSFLTTFGFGITGRASLQLDTDYKPNETLNGVLRLSLQDGELIPADSKIIIDMNGEEYSYILSELVSAEQVEGNFYVKDLNISGKGLGFGKQGVKKSSVDVDFELEIFDQDTEIIPVEKEKETETEENVTNEENTTNGKTISNEENKTTETTPKETTGATETSEGNSDITSQTTQIESEKTTTQSTTSPPAQPPGEATANGETTSAIMPPATTPTETTSSETSTSSSSSESSETSSSESTTESSGITGGFVKTITGLISIDLVESVDGSTTYDSPFEYQLPEGKTSSIKSGSVSVNGEVIDDSYVSISIQNGVAVVSTNYAGDDTGFGQEYLNEKDINYDIELTKLNLIARDGTMTIKVLYGDNVIVETSSELSVSLEEPEKISAFSEEEFFNTTSYQLTKEERDLLTEKTGNDVVETREANIINDRLVIKYKLGNYWMQFSYDYPGSLTETLNKRIEFERKQWVKTLAQSLSKKDSEAEEVMSLKVGKFPLNETETSIITFPSRDSAQIVEATSQNRSTTLPEENTTIINSGETTNSEVSSQSNATIIEEQNIAEVSELEQNYSI